MKLSLSSVFILLTLTNTYGQSSSDTSDDLVVISEPYQNITHEKHESLINCLSFDLAPGEYEMFPNGTAYVEAYNKTYNQSFYILRNDILTVCVPEIPEDTGYVSQEYLSKMNYLTQAGLAISIICLLLHLVVFMMVPELRNLPGYNLASLCFSLLLGYIFMLMVAGNDEFRESEFCVASASLIHFFLMASFLWMSVMAFDIYKSLLHATGNLKTSSSHFKLKKFVFYSLFAWIVALAFTTSALVVDTMEDIPEVYRPAFRKFCWFAHRKSLLIFFAGPVFALTSINFLLFGLSTYTIFANRMKTDQDSHRSTLKRNYLMYFRLAIIMGVTWITGVLAAIVDTEWLWYLFSALNTLQGLFIFLAFTCTGKVKKYFRAKLLGARRSSEQTLAPTFQSYCFYANSIEKDLNKVVDNDKKSDTIVIHL